jgi:diaminopimelate epimerase
MNFAKLQGAGNDFVLVETGDTGRDWARVAVAICNRRFGVGADGLLLLLPSEVADVGMRIFNADGSEAEVCGNGLRCLVRYALDRGLVVGRGVRDVSIETVAGIRSARIRGKLGGSPEIQVGLGTPRFKAEDIPVSVGSSAGLVDIKSMLRYTVTVESKELGLNLVSMGNPHAVHFVSQPVADFPLVKLGPRVEHHEIFPQRTNFEVARVLSREEIEARVWERGVGETLACGSGAAAVAVVAQLRGLVGRSVAVKLPGGVLDVDWDGSGEILLGGPAEMVFTGKWLGEV